MTCANLMNFKIDNELFKQFLTNFKTKQWTFFIELWPLIHSCVIAYQTGNRDLPQREDLWPIFFFGFTTGILVTV